MKEDKSEISVDIPKSPKLNFIPFPKIRDLGKGPDGQSSRSPECKRSRRCSSTSSLEVDGHLLGKIRPSRFE
uniref:Uncharacterized protein n=1 Tax=Steinernema glaseri TaxID=37863 RepID=A0A1I8AMD6_9BILA